MTKRKDLLERIALRMTENRYSNDMLIVAVCKESEKSTYECILKLLIITK